MIEEFARHVAEMRTAQKEYFLIVRNQGPPEERNAALSRAKELERSVDAAVHAILNPPAANLFTETR